MSRLFWIALLIVMIVAVFTLPSIVAAVEVPVRGVVVRLSERQVEQCVAEGGCVVVSKKQAEAWRQRAYEAGIRDTRIECRRFL